MSMMGFTFPSSPTVGELYSPGGVDIAYRWDGRNWMQVPPLDQSRQIQGGASKTYVDAADAKLQQQIDALATPLAKAGIDPAELPPGVVIVKDGVALFDVGGLITALFERVVIAEATLAALTQRSS